MTNSESRPPAQAPSGLSRRNLIQSAAAIAVGSLAVQVLAQPSQPDSAKPTKPGADPKPAKPAVSRPIRVGVIGCGGRGTGAAVNSLQASNDTRIVALADVFPERIEAARKQLQGFGERGAVDDARCFVGFDAYRKLCALDLDYVILATAPHFRPIHLAEAVANGRHVFMEKPCGVDPSGIRSVLASADVADQKKLCIVAGTQRRHESCYLEAMKRVHAGDLGRIVTARCYWNQGGLWMHPRQPEWSDMEWQLRNWLYFTWLSGDHIVEQHVHNLDVINWALRANPVKCTAMGGRQVRTDPAYGHVFDHFCCEYEYPDGVTVISQCRQIDGCAGRVEEVIEGTDGRIVTMPGRAKITGRNAWNFSENDNDPYTAEHADLVQAIQSGTHVNEARNVATSTMTAVMGRMAAYTGKTVTWEQVMKSDLSLAPASYAFGPLPVAPVAMPGKAG
ncbi:MAG: Gfo/Idh/MocA family oxidoreductase [Phycisphaerales bacterium]